MGERGGGLWREGRGGGGMGEGGGSFTSGRAIVLPSRKRAHILMRTRADIRAGTHSGRPGPRPAPAALPRPPVDADAGAAARAAGVLLPAVLADRPPAAAGLLAVLALLAVFAVGGGGAAGGGAAGVLAAPLGAAVVAQRCSAAASRVRACDVAVRTASGHPGTGALSASVAGALDGAGVFGRVGRPFA